MAYNADNEIREELAQVQKNSRGEYVIATKITNKTSGSVSVDIRQYYTNEVDEVKPTSKGIRINAELLPELLNGLVRALEANEMMDLSDTLNDLAEGLDDSDMPQE
jgi:hypothetical protein